MKGFILEYNQQIPKNFVIAKKKKVKLNLVNDAQEKSKRKKKDE